MSLYLQLTKLWQMVKYVWKYIPLYPVIVLIQSVCDALWNVVSGLIFIKYLFDAIEGEADFVSVLWVSLGLAAFRVIQILFNNWADNVFKPKAELSLHEAMQGELYRKALEVDIESYDDPGFYDRYVWSMKEADSRAVQIVKDFFGFFAACGSLLVMIGILLTIDLAVTVGILLACILDFYINLRLNKIRFDKSVEKQKLSRKADYYKRVFYLADYAKELREGEISDYLSERYRDSLDGEVLCVKKYIPSLFGWTLFSQLITGVLFDAGMTGYVIVKYATDPDFSLGDFSIVINSIWKLFVQCNTVIQYVTTLQEDALYTDKFMTFLETRPKITGEKKEVEPFASIELSDVSFSYPFMPEGKRALNHVSLRVNRGEKIAIVGYNGAGKTTLANLLLRFYDPDEGEVKYNGKTIREYDPEAYRRTFGLVFQDYKVFAATVGENIVGGPCGEEQKQKVWEAAAAGSFERKLKTLPNGTDTMLTREFDPAGVNLSGGEVQKVALSYLMFHQFDLAIMDEPSSALDPKAEYELNRAIEQAMTGKTLILISHRLTSVHIVDRIYMMGGGQILEQGTHEELMAMNGKYAEMYLEQAKRYREEQA